MNVRSLVGIIGDQLADGGSFVVRNRDQQTQLNGLRNLGMVAMEGWNFSTANGVMTISTRRPCTRVCRNGPATAQTAPVARNAVGSVVRGVTDHGLTIPQNLLREIRANRTVYIRHVSHNSFLVMRERGTHQNTFAVRTYSDGRLVLSRTTLGRALYIENYVFDGEDYRISHNGNTRQSLFVEMI